MVEKQKKSRSEACLSPPPPRDPSCAWWYPSSFPLTHCDLNTSNLFKPIRPLPPSCPHSPFTPLLSMSISLSPPSSSSHGATRPSSPAHSSLSSSPRPALIYPPPPPPRLHHSAAGSPPFPENLFPSPPAPAAAALLSQFHPLSPHPLQPLLQLTPPFPLTPLSDPQPHPPNLTLPTCSCTALLLKSYSLQPLLSHHPPPYNPSSNWPPLFLPASPLPVRLPPFSTPPTTPPPTPPPLPSPPQSPPVPAAVLLPS